MSRYLKKAITCKCCGNEYQGDVLMGFTTDRNVMDLDTNPHEPAVYDQIIQCPKCGYSALGYSKDVDEKTKELVGSEEYQAILQSNEGDRITPKLTCAALIAEKQKDYRAASYFALLQLWHLKEINADGSKQIEVRGKAIGYFEEYLTYNLDVNAAMIMIDLLRQAKRFDDAMETVCSLESYITKNEPLKKVAAFEKRLIHEEDYSDHKIGEVDS